MDDDDEVDFRPLHIALVAEDPLARGALTRALNDSRAVKVVSEAAPVDGAFDALPPSVEAVVWDAGVHAGPMPAFENAPGPVIVLVADEQAAGVALAHGARGVLFRDADASILVPAIKAVAANLVVVEPELSSGPVSASTRVTSDLTPREREVLVLVAEGLSNRLIAQRLGISEHTAKFHVNALLEKLSAGTRTEAVVKAARSGLLTL